MLNNKVCFSERGSNNGMRIFFHDKGSGQDYHNRILFSVKGVGLRVSNEGSWPDALFLGIGG